jgi:hypothetical protein
LEGYERVRFCSVDLTSGDDTPPDSIDMLGVKWCVQAVFGTGGKAT